MNRMKRCFRCGKYGYLYGDAQRYCITCHRLKLWENNREDK